MTAQVSPRLPQNCSPSKPKNRLDSLRSHSSQKSQAHYDMMKMNSSVEEKNLKTEYPPAKNSV